MTHSEWEHLRLCTQCGHVGGCDDSPFRHATKHFTRRATRSFVGLQPGEDWASGASSG